MSGSDEPVTEVGEVAEIEFRPDRRFEAIVENMGAHGHFPETSRGNPKGNEQFSFTSAQTDPIDVNHQGMTAGGSAGMSVARVEQRCTEETESTDRSSNEAPPPGRVKPRRHPKRSPARRLHRGRDVAGIDAAGDQKREVNQSGPVRQDLRLSTCSAG